MFKKILLLMTAVLLSVNGSLFAIDHWWHGGVSAEVNDPANWTDRDAATDPTTPMGDPYDIVRIGASWGSEDLNGNGVLDAGEDLNGNGEIDNPIPGQGHGTGSYDLAFDLPVDPVLSETYVSRNGDEYGGWWFVLNAPNILTLKDGAYLIMNRENCNLRNGGRLEVQGRSGTDGPSLIVARRFRIAENGSATEAAGETCQLCINGTGWMQVDPFLAETGEAFMIGMPDDPGTMPRGEIVIEDSGRLELVEDGLDELYLDFGNADPSVNQIIIRDNGELWLYGDTASMGRVGSDDTETSLNALISMGLITNDQGGQIEVTVGSPGTPTVVKVMEGTSVENNPAVVPLTYALNQNYPNPFNPETTIKFKIPKNGRVKLSVYNIHGKEIAVLVNDFRTTGTYSVSFNGSNIPSGVYFYRLESNGYNTTKRMLLLK